jgi:hypothetical protein
MENNSFVLEVIRLTNQYRSDNGLSPLSIDLDLQEAAQQHSQNMANQDFFSHTGLDGSSSAQRALNAGYESSFVGENIGAGYQTPQAVVDGWINSPGHRANILNTNYNEIGVGYYFLANDTGNVNYNSYWTQVFGKGDIEDQPTGVSDQGAGNSGIDTQVIDVSSLFNPFQYCASHPDLIQILGLNQEGLVQHYNNHGKFEQRAIDSFDEYSYIASYSDLITAFGTNGEAATQHYIQQGYYEGRSPDLFAPEQYLASYDDLINVFGNNYNAATIHYIQNGYHEGRSKDVFNEYGYIASYSDLITTFGTNGKAATHHYINHGIGESRTTDLFDPIGYLASHQDLQNAFGNNFDLATKHYIQYGYYEGRGW